MQSSNPTEHQKFSFTPPAHGEPVSGTPVGSTNAPSQPTKEMPWSTGLCDCFDDVHSCCLTFWCPCITFGRIAEIVDKGSTSCGTSGALYALISLLTGYACIYSCFYRSKMRRQYMLQPSPCGDCLVHCCCEHCALCQEYRELKNRGFDPSIGWHENVEKQNRGVTIAPVVDGGMSRADK